MGVHVPCSDLPFCCASLKRSSEMFRESRPADAQKDHPSASHSPKGGGKRLFPLVPVLLPLVGRMWKDTAAGMAGSVSCTMLGLPFDVAKSRIQTGGRPYPGLVETIGRTLRTEGPQALYKGTVPALSSAMTENAVGITVQRSLRRWLAAACSCAPDTRFSMPTEVALGGATGVFTAIAICPFEVLKVRLQVQVRQTLAGECMQVVRREGPLGLYRGFTALLLRDVVSAPLHPRVSA
jgi:hypothetical protein